MTDTVACFPPPPGWAKNQPIFTFHLPTGTAPLEAIKAQMNSLGAPQLEVVDYGHTLVLLDGVHRLQAAYQQDIFPKFSRLSPEATLADAPLWCAAIQSQAEPGWETTLRQAPKIFLGNWVIVQAATLTISFGEAGIRFMRTKRGRIDLIQNYDPNDFRESIEFERYLVNKDNLHQFGCDVPAMGRTLKGKVNARNFKRMSASEGQKTLKAWHRRDETGGK